MSVDFADLCPRSSVWIEQRFPKPDATVPHHPPASSCNPADCNDFGGSTFQGNDLTPTAPINTVPPGSGRFLPVPVPDRRRHALKHAFSTRPKRPTSEAGRERCRDRYAFLKEREICVRCGAADAVKGKVRCEPCNDDDVSRRNDRAARVKASGKARCSTCLSHKPRPGLKTCKKCAKRGARRTRDLTVERMISRPSVPNPVRRRGVAA